MIIHRTKWHYQLWHGLLVGEVGPALSHKIWAIVVPQKTQHSLTTNLVFNQWNSPLILLICLLNSSFPIPGDRRGDSWPAKSSVRYFCDAGWCIWAETMHEVLKTTLQRVSYFRTLTRTLVKGAKIYTFKLANLLQMKAGREKKHMYYCWVLLLAIKCRILSQYYTSFWDPLVCL